jgi:hypothetical protein
MDFFNHYKFFFMRKALVMSVFSILAGMYVAKAQLQKGNVLVGGDIASFDLGLNEGNSFNMRIDPKAAWFIQNNVAVGGFIDIGLSTAKGAGTTVNYGVGALGRYYFSQAEVNVLRQTRLFLEATVGLSGVNPAFGGNTNGLGLGFGPGLAHFITSNIGLEALLKYNGVIGFGSAATSSRLQLGIGFQIYLPNRTVRREIEKVK